MRRGQVIITTHSPIAVQALAATDISVVRCVDGLTEVTQVPEEINEAQGALRAGPTAVLARRVVVGEGATEAGILRALIQRWDAERIASDAPTHAALGATYFNGGGAHAAMRAKVYRQLGVASALLVDNDDRGVDKHIDDAEQSGVTVARWRLGNSTEKEIISEVADEAGLLEIVALAISHKGSDAVEAHLRAGLPSLPGTLDPCDPATWAIAGYALSDVQAAIITAAGGGTGKDRDKRAWFKREDAGESLGEFIYRHWNRFEGTHLGTELAKVRRFIYDDKEWADTSESQGPR